MKMNNIPLILEGRTEDQQKWWGIFFALIELQRGAENWITDFWIP